VDGLIFHLDRSVALRVSNVPKRSLASLPPPDETPSERSTPARVAVLFSGGIDSTACAFLAHKYVGKPSPRAVKSHNDRHIPLDEPIDLLNIAFENPRKIRVQVDGNVGSVNKKKQKSKMLQDAKSTDGQLSGRYDPDYLVPDRSAGLSELEELRRLCPGRQWNFVSRQDRIRTCRFDPGYFLGRNRCTIRRISSRPANCEIHHVALSDRHGPGR
jgi:hypothetical protein